MAESEDRRKFLRVALIGGIAVVSGGAGAASVFTPPHTHSETEPGPRPLAPMIALGAIEKGAVLGVEISLSVRDGWRLRNKQQRVYIVRTGDGEDAASFKALSPICSHAGCTIEYHDDDGRFVCPCHDARFEKDGTLIDGPAPRDMDPLDVSIAEYEGRAWLFVDWREFVIGTEVRTPRGRA